MPIPIPWSFVFLPFPSLTPLSAPSIASDIRAINSSGPSLDRVRFFDSVTTVPFSISRTDARSFVPPRSIPMAYAGIALAPSGMSLGAAVYVSRLPANDAIATSSRSWALRFGPSGRHPASKTRESRTPAHARTIDLRAFKHPVHEDERKRQRFHRHRQPPGRAPGRVGG